VSFLGFPYIEAMEIFGQDLLFMKSWGNVMHSFGQEPLALKIFGTDACFQRLPTPNHPLQWFNFLFAKNFILRIL
jgi:hypothetical protein